MPMRLYAELPAFEGVTDWVNGKVDKEALRGKTVLVHFWAVSCHLCKEEFPIVNHWREAYGERYPLQLVGVHIPRSDADRDAGPVMEAIRKYELTHPVIIDNARTVSDAFGNPCVPAYYLFDENLKLRHSHMGERGLRLVNERLMKILGVKPEGEIGGHAQ